ncbi:MAG: serine hydrolase domain-containing protein [Gemmatimonadales bacterium]
MHRSISIAALAVLAGGVPVQAQSDEPAVRRAREMVALISGGTEAALKAYVDSAFGGRMGEMPFDAHWGFLMSTRASTGGFEWIEGRAEAPGAAVAAVKSRLTGNVAGLMVRVEPTPPNRILGLGTRPAPAWAPVEKLAVASDPELARSLQGFVEKLARADAFSGAVLLAKDGRVLYQGAFGLANRDFDAANTVDTKFNLGSMNKMFTSVAIAQLAEAGKLRLDDPLSKYVPDFPNPEAAAKIKIEHLLTHTSGLGSYFNEEFSRSSRARFRTVDQMLELAKNETLAFEPGTRWSYSNTGMLVLGKVIEVASGQDYFDYIREHLYAPAGMTRSDSYELDRVNPNLAVGYQKEFGADGAVSYRNNLYMHVIRGGPAGGGYSTVGDLLAFAKALTAGKLVGRQYVDLLTTPKPELNSPSYGYGFGVDTETGIVGHSGGFPGISSNLDIFTKSGYVAVVMSNYGGGSQPVVEQIRALVKARVGSPTASGGR